MGFLPFSKTSAGSLCAKMLFVLLPFSGFAQQKEGFTIQGSIKGWPDGKVLAVFNEEIAEKPLANGVVKNGSFLLKGVVDEVKPFFIGEEGSNERILVFLDNTNITIAGHKDSLQQVRVTGSVPHNDYQYFVDNFTPLFNEVTTLSKQRQAGGSDSLENAIEKKINGIQQKVDEYIKNRSTSPIAPFVVLITSDLSGDPALKQQRFDRLNPTAQQSYFGKVLAKMIADANFGQIGSAVPSFSQNDPSGKPVTLESFKGKYVLLDFWASWCGPCRTENPNVVSAFEKFKDKNFTVLGISLDKDKAAWLEAIKEDKLNWTQVSDLKFWQNEVAQMFRIQSIPQNFLIDPNGKIVAKNLRGPVLTETLEKVLAAPHQ